MALVMSMLILCIHSPECRQSSGCGVPEGKYQATIHLDATHPNTIVWDQWKSVLKSYGLVINYWNSSNKSYSQPSCGSSCQELYRGTRWLELIELAVELIGRHSIRRY
jgi:hypothetical protein